MTTRKLAVLNSIMVPILLRRITEEDGNPVSAWAARNGFLQMVHWLPDDHLLLEHRDSEGRTPLYCAALTGNIPMARLLLRRGADIEGISSNRRTALHGASIAGHESTVLYFLGRGADMFSTDMSQRTGMDYAIIYKHIKVIELFLSQGMPVDYSVQGPPWCTPLHTAISFGRLSVVGLLLTFGANPNLPYNADLISPAHLAVRYYDNHTYILSNKPDVGEVLKPEEATIQIITLLSAFGGSVSTGDADGINALHAAVSAGLLDVVRFILLYKENLNAQNANGETALHISALNGDLEMYNVLIGGGLDPDIRRHDGRTPVELLPVNLRAMPQPGFWSSIAADIILNRGAYLFTISFIIGIVSSLYRLFFG